MGVRGVLVASGLPGSMYLMLVKMEEGSIELRMFSSRSCVQRKLLVEYLKKVLMEGIF